jgi:hypothetical protein
LIVKDGHSPFLKFITQHPPVEREKGKMKGISRRVWLEREGPVVVILCGVKNNRQGDRFRHSLGCRTNNDRELCVCEALSVGYLDLGGVLSSLSIRHGEYNGSFRWNI